LSTSWGGVHREKENPRGGGEVERSKKWGTCHKQNKNKLNLQQGKNDPGEQCTRSGEKRGSDPHITIQVGSTNFQGVLQNPGGGGGNRAVGKKKGTAQWCCITTWGKTKTWNTRNKPVRQRSSGRNGGQFTKMWIFPTGCTEDSNSDDPSQGGEN